MIQNWMFKLTCKLSLCLCYTLFAQVYIIHTLIKLDVKLVWKFNSTNLFNSYFTKVWVHIPSLNIQINLYVHLYVRLKTLPFWSALKCWFWQMIQKKLIDKLHIHKRHVEIMLLWYINWFFSFQVVNKKYKLYK